MIMFILICPCQSVSHIIDVHDDTSVIKDERFYLFYYCRIYFTISFPAACQPLKPESSSIT